ncbi:MAG: hypothetical protein LBS21_00605 [Clostridiales bacterium]|jgi:hypothetical protein|nr:hypothetical protein [Clostridiales bacterium]
MGDINKGTTTYYLSKIFKTNNISEYISQNKGNMKQVIPFHIYISQLCEKRKAIRGQVISKSTISRTYAYKFFNGTRTPSRDHAVLLAFGFEMNYDEAQELLTAAGYNQLYSKVERDAVLIYAINKKLPVIDTQIMLTELSHPLLGADEKMPD